MKKLLAQIPQNNFQTLDKCLEQLSIFKAAKADLITSFSRYKTEFEKNTPNKSLNIDFTAYHDFERSIDHIFQNIKLYILAKNKFEESKAAYLNSIMGQQYILDYAEIKSYQRAYELDKANYLLEKRTLSNVLHLYDMDINLDYNDVAEDAKLVAFGKVDEIINYYRNLLIKFDEACKKFDDSNQDSKKESYHQVEMLYSEIIKTKPIIQTNCLNHFSLPIGKIFVEEESLESKFQNRKTIFDKQQKNEKEKEDSKVIFLNSLGAIKSANNMNVVKLIEESLDKVKSVQDLNLLMLAVRNIDFPSVLSFFKINSPRDKVMDLIFRKFHVLIKYDPDNSYIDSSYKLIHHAAYYGAVDILKELLKPENINQQTEYNDTALHIAVHQGHDDAVRLLLAGGADIKLTTTEGNTPLDIALHRTLIHLERASEKRADKMKLLQYASILSMLVDKDLLNAVTLHVLYNAESNVRKSNDKEKIELFEKYILKPFESSVSKPRQKT